MGKKGAPIHGLGIRGFTEEKEADPSHENSGRKRKTKKTHNT